MQRVLEVPYPLDLGRTLLPLRVGRHDPTIRLSEHAVLRSTRTPDGPATVRASHRDDQIDVEAWGPGATWALDHAPGLFGLRDDREAFEPRPGLVQRLHHDHPGLRLPRTDRVVEALLPAVLGQRVTGFEATRAYVQLIERWGEPAPGPGGLLLVPQAEVIAELAYYDLHLIGMEKKRADALKRVCAHGHRLEDAAAAGPRALRERLESIPGVGLWTSAEVSRLALGDADAVSVGDYHLKHLVSYALAGEERGSDARMLELLEPYLGHRGRVCRLLEVARVGAPRKAPRQAIQPIAGR